MSKVSLPAQQERQLVCAAQADPQKFDHLYNHYYPHIRRFFGVKIIEAAVIDDLTSQTFAKALGSIKRFEWRGYSFSAWLYRIAHNILIDYYRQQAKYRRRIESLESQLIDVPEEKPSLDADIQSEWAASKLKGLISDLDPLHQKIMLFKFYEGRTNRQIAKSTGLSETNVGSIIHRLVKKLRTLMTEK